MAYSNFTFDKAKSAFGLETNSECALVRSFPPFPLSDESRKQILHYLPAAKNMGTEKAYSEYVIAPIIGFCHDQTKQTSFFSGPEFNVDKSVGLNGTADFLLSLSPEPQSVEAPVVVVVEAKKGDLKTAHGQCMATMVAAQKFNEQRSKPIETIWGICTTGKEWQFLKIEGKKLFIDIDEYHIAESLEKIIGVIVGLLNQPNP